MSIPATESKASRKFIMRLFIELLLIIEFALLSSCCNPFLAQQYPGLKIN